MIIVYKKENGKCVSELSKEYTFEMMYKDNEYANQTLDWIEIDDNFVFDRISNYKVINDELVRITKEEINSEIDQNKPYHIKKTEELETENARLWYQNMLLEGRIEKENADIWYAIMTGGDE